MFSFMDCPRKKFVFSYEHNDTLNIKNVHSMTNFLETSTNIDRPTQVLIYSTNLQYEDLFH